MHTAKAPPMEIAEDVRRIMRSHMFVKNVDRGEKGRRGEASITFRNSCEISFSSYLFF